MCTVILAPWSELTLSAVAVHAVGTHVRTASGAFNAAYGEKGIVGEAVSLDVAVELLTE